MKVRTKQLFSLNLAVVCLLIPIAVWTVLEQLPENYEDQTIIHRRNKNETTGILVVAEQYVRRRNEFEELHVEQREAIIKDTWQDFETLTPTRQSPISTLWKRFKVQDTVFTAIQRRTENNALYAKRIDTNEKLKPTNFINGAPSSAIQGYTSAHGENLGKKEENHSKGGKFLSLTLEDHDELQKVVENEDGKNIKLKDRDVATPTATEVDKFSAVWNHHGSEVRTIKTKVLLIIAIISAPGRSERRRAIRQTWMSKCRTNKQVLCRFFTDKFVKAKDISKQLQLESKLNEDIEFLPLSEGISFGLRLLLVLKWSTRNYDFQYLLRMDDDYYMCLDGLLEELSRLPAAKILRGYMHCKYKATRVDEGWMLLSNVLIKSFLSRENSLLCHPMGDQQVALWLNDEKNVAIYHDFRIHHHPPASKVHRFKENPLVCRQYIAVHGTYPSLMEMFWDASLRSRQSQVVPDTPLMPSYQYCSYDGPFDWRFIGTEGTWYRLPPKPCRDNPTWNLTNSPFMGRQRTY